MRHAIRRPAAWMLALCCASGVGADETFTIPKPIKPNVGSLPDVARVRSKLIGKDEARYLALKEQDLLRRAADTSPLVPLLMQENEASRQRLGAVGIERAAQTTSALTAVSRRRTAAA